LWSVCNKTQLSQKQVDVQDRIETSTLTTKSLPHLGIDMSLNLTTKSLLLNPTTKIEYVENCYSKFFLKEGLPFLFISSCSMRILISSLFISRWSFSVYYFSSSHSFVSHFKYNSNAHRLIVLYDT